MVSCFIDKKISELLGRYEDDITMTFGDLVDAVEDILSEYPDDGLSLIVDRYRREERYDREFLGMRGDMESEEEAFLTALNARVESVPNKEPEEVIASGVWDYTLIRQVIDNKRPYPAVLIEKVVGAKNHELPLLEKAGYTLQGDSYVPPVELK